MAAVAASLRYAELGAATRRWQLNVKQACFRMALGAATRRCIPPKISELPEAVATAQSMACFTMWLRAATRRCIPSKIAIAAGMGLAGLSFGTRRELRPAFCDDATAISPPLPGTCAVRSSFCGSRGLFALQSFQPGQLIFEERAILQSNASATTLSAVFKEGSPGFNPRADAIWGIVANFATLPADEGDDINGGAFHQDRFISLKQFYQPLSVDQMHMSHAHFIHGALRDDLSPPLAAEELARLLQIVQLDAHNFSITGLDDGSGITRVGVALFFWLHLANHSCLPNAFFTASAMDGDSGEVLMTLHALRPISPDEEICISYLDGRTLLLHTLTQRRAALQRRFGFLCTCARCCREEQKI